jgi:hypothetical protein
MEPGRFAGNPPYYVLLEVSPDADAASVQAAFRRQVLRYHPDVNPDPGAAARMRDINAAYAILSDPVRRAAYDAAHAVDRSGGAVYAGARPATTATARGVGVRAAGGSYAPRWGGAVGGPRPAATVGVATATTHGTSFLDPDQPPAHAARQAAPQAPDLGWAARVARAMDVFAPGVVREVSPTVSRATVTPVAGASRMRTIGGVLAALMIALAGAAAGTALWGGPGILSTASVASGASLPGAQMVAPAPRQAVLPAKPATVAVLGQSTAAEPVAPSAPAVPVAQSGAGIPAPLAPLGAPVAPVGAPGSVAGAPVVNPPAVAVPGASVPVSAAADASRPVNASSNAATTTTNAAPANDAPRAAATPAASVTSGLRALNSYDQAWTAYASTLRRVASGDATSSGAPLAMARARLLEARTVWIRQAATTADPIAAGRMRDAITLTAEADDLARDAASLVSSANGAPVPAAKSLLDEAARRHARALATWAAANTPA